MENGTKDRANPNMSFRTKAKRLLKVNPKLIPVKLLMFLLYGGMAGLYPFLIVHMKDIGLTSAESAYINAMLPFVTCIGPPLGGALADKLGNYKVVLIGVNLISIVFHYLILYAVPPARPIRTTAELPVTNGSLSLFCDSNNAKNLLPPNEILIDQCRDGSIANFSQILSTRIQFDDCMSTCRNSASICFGSDAECQPSTFFRNRSFPDMMVQGHNRSLQLKTIMAPLSDDNDGEIRCRLPGAPPDINCTITCAIRADFFVNCSTVKPAQNRAMTLGLYSLFRLLATGFAYTLMPLLDAVAYQLSDEQEGDLGFQRVWALFGMCGCPPLSGWLIGYATKLAKGVDDYSPPFHVFGGMHFTAAIITCFMSASLRTAAENIWSNVGKLFRNPKITVFVIMMFLAGCAWGFLETFLFWFMKDIGASTLLMGMTNTVSGLSAVPVVLASTLLIKFFGHTKIIMFCLAIYGCRFLSYSVIYEPYHVLPVEILEAFTTSLFGVVSSVYCGKIAPDYLATLQGVVGGLHSAFGRGCGSLVGGLMFEYIGARRTYVYFGSAYICFGALYAVLHYAWLRRLPNPQASARAAKQKEGLLQPSAGQVTVEYQLSPEDEEVVAKLARMDALTRRYSQAPVIVESSATRKESSGSSKADRLNVNAPALRRRSTLVPSVMSLTGR
ncbi:major facilitator superfamily domain-containing protein 6-like [Paramacrobiotus metropolitanus]|uniref:major facilitator superfamily domain-containing protein 6-like n=1 Tax=Paramacrobiotus metropolitanus TaxID=2943436 RepID=UPI00244646AF|nr:major facilitator superfamily domain-containing protein 6-like [Paramacrobiotus metropolitanus]